MNPTVQAWLAGVDARNSHQVSELLADQVVLHSPVVSEPQTGKELVGHYLAAVFRVFAAGHFRYTRVLADPHDAALEFEVQVDGVLVNGIDLLRFGPDGKIVDFKVMVRPLAALKALQRAIAAALGPL